MNCKLSYWWLARECKFSIVDTKSGKFSTLQTQILFSYYQFVGANYSSGNLMVTILELRNFWIENNTLQPMLRIVLTAVIKYFLKEIKTKRKLKAWETSKNYCITTADVKNFSERHTIQVKKLKHKKQVIIIGYLVLHFSKFHFSSLFKSH